MVKGWVNMQFSINYSSINTMLQLCSKLKSGTLKEEEIRQLLKHEDYKFEFSRYNNRISEEEFVEYFLNVPNLDQDSITNDDLKIHHKYYMDLFDNLDFYIEKEKELQKLLGKDIFQEQINYAMQGLPDDFELPELKFYFTIGIGQSFGYVYKNGMHFDYLQLIKEKSLEDFCSTIAHEVHHVGMHLIHDSICINDLPLEALFYLCFSSEGLAVKYCNNAEGTLSKAINAGVKNIGLDSFTWKYLNDDFDNTMKQFKATIKRIRNNEIKSMDELVKHIEEYWMCPLTNEQEIGEVPKLKHFRLYSFGNDIWGVIHDCFGKSVVYETLKNPQSFPEVFNDALRKLGRIDLLI